MFYESDCLARFVSVGINSKKQVDVVGHDDEFAACDAVVAFSVHVCGEMIVKPVVGKQGSAVKCAEGDEVQWRVKFLEYVRQVRRSSWMMIGHGESVDGS